MSKKSMSRNSMLEERIKSCFSKKNPRLVDSSIYDLPYLKQSKPKPKKPSNNQKKDNNNKIGLTTQEIIKTSSSSENKGSSLGTQGNNVEDCLKQEQVKTYNTKKLQTQTYQQSKDEIANSCNIGPLKTLVCQKLNDCDFFSGEENIKNSSKRLLFLQYSSKELYINKSRQKSKERIKEKVIPKDIQKVFNNVKSPKNYFAINIKIPTEQTEYTSDPPSNYSKMTPPGLTPRSFGQAEDTHNRRLSFTFAPPPMTIQKQEVMKQPQQSYFYPQPYYYFGGYQGMEFQSQPRKKKSYDEQSRDYQVEPDKIEADGRTTLMIKNIPNKYTREMLYELFDRQHKKKYDFLYLPIDSTNSCNIGYAFINFTSTNYISDFYKMFNNQRWEKFNSDKICQLTYARMQGASSLVQHMQSNNNRTKRFKNIEQNISSMSAVLCKQKSEY